MGKSERREVREDIKKRRCDDDNPRSPCESSQASCEVADAVRAMSLLKAVKDKGVPLSIEAHLQLSEVDKDIDDILMT